MGVIFVSGVHGVGKSTACAYAARQLGWVHRSASLIIAEQGREAIDSNTKSVRNIGRNQELLVQGIRRYRTNGNGNLLIDGHFTVINAEGEIEDIDESVFVELNFDSFFLLEDDPKQIAGRLQERDGTCVDPGRIAEHQNRERNRAKFLAMRLGVPIQILSSTDRAEFVLAVSRIS